MTCRSATECSFLHRLYSTLLDRMGEYRGVDRVVEFGWIEDALGALHESAEASGDRQIADIVDDMLYVINETAMGAQGKGVSILPAIKQKIDLLEQSTGTDKV